MVTPNEPTSPENCSKHPETIKLYTSVLLDFFGNVETKHLTKEGTEYRKLPVIYANREKLIAIEEHSFKNLFNGNTNFLPRASLEIVSVQHNTDRSVNKSLTFPTSFNSGTLYAPVAYDISVKFSVLTRGVDQAFLICEQICSRFTPFLNIKVHESEHLGEQGEVRLKLEGVTFDPQEYDDYSQSEVLTEYDFTLFGQMFRRPFDTNEVLTVQTNLKTE